MPFGYNLIGGMETHHSARAENTSFVQQYHNTGGINQFSHWYLIFLHRESKMVTDNMITELTQTVSGLKRDVDILKEDNSYLYKKLEKAYDDRIALRSENYNLKSKVNGHSPETAEEEECISCSA